MANTELADRLNDAFWVLRTVSPDAMAEACARQNYEPSGPLDGSLLDDMLEAASLLREVPS